MEVSVTFCKLALYLWYHENTCDGTRFFSMRSLEMMWTVILLLKNNNHLRNELDTHGWIADLKAVTSPRKVGKIQLQVFPLNRELETPWARPSRRITSRQDPLFLYIKHWGIWNFRWPQFSRNKNEQTELFHLVSLHMTGPWFWLR